MSLGSFPVFFYELNYARVHVHTHAHVQEPPVINPCRNRWGSPLPPSPSHPGRVVTEECDHLQNQSAESQVSCCSWDANLQLRRPSNSSNCAYYLSHTLVAEEFLQPWRLPSSLLPLPPPFFPATPPTPLLSSSCLLAPSHPRLPLPNASFLHTPHCRFVPLEFLPRLPPLCFLKCCNGLLRLCGWIGIRIGIHIEQACVGVVNLGGCYVATLETQSAMGELKYEILFRWLRLWG